MDGPYSGARTETFPNSQVIEAMRALINWLMEEYANIANAESYATYDDENRVFIINIPFAPHIYVIPMQLLLSRSFIIQRRPRTIEDNPTWWKKFSRAYDYFDNGEVFASVFRKPATGWHSKTDGYEWIKVDGVKVAEKRLYFLKIKGVNTSGVSSTALPREV